MILDELVLRNVGTFAGRHAIALTPDPGKPAVLIGGLNGTGKTTILDAINVSLYGALAPGRRSGSYESYLAGLIHHGVSSREGASVELAFRAHQQGAERQYRIIRSWRSAGSVVRESLDVEINGHPDRVLTSTWSEHAETFLPRGIAGLFFFDGEQIEALADLERSRQVLGSALAALLGLDLVQRLATDLAVIRRRHRVQQIPDSLRDAVDERQRAVTVARQAEQAESSAVANARVELERAEKKFFELTERYRSAGGDLLDQHKAAEARSLMLRDELARTEDEFRDELAGPAPFLLVAASLSGMAVQAQNEAAAARERIVVEAVTDRDDAIISQLRATGASRRTISALETFLAADRDRRSACIAVPEVTELRDPGAIEFLITRVLPAARDRIRALAVRRDSIQKDLEAAERLLAAIPNPESLAPLREERDTAAADVAAARTSLTRAEDRLALLRRERDRAGAAYEAAMERAAQASLIADDDRRLVDHIDRVCVTLEALRAAATRKHLARISDLVLEALSQLLRKESLITGITINPDSHTVELAGRGGRQIPAQDLSAGERQLLAVAILWGLARASGQPLPVVIDTPLGRLDSSHRRHLVDRYFPCASHQVILLSTDTEIDEDAYRQLRPRVARAYRLEFDQTANATQVKNGYFWD